MDINSLLSPQDSPASEHPPSPALPSPTIRSPSNKKRPGLRQMPSRTPSGLREQITSSPQLYQHERLPTPTHAPAPAGAAAAYHQHGHGGHGHGHGGYQPQHQSHHLHPQQPQHQQPQPQPGPALHSPQLATYTNGRASHSATSTPPLDARPQVNSPHVMTPPHPIHRQASTPGMDTLADLAAMQHVQQTARQQSVGQRPTISLQNIPRSISGSSAADVTMVDSPKLPRTFHTKALDAQSIEMLGQLEKSLIENPFDYYSHVSFISVLHQGLQNSIQGATDSPADPSSYELLPELREAYKAMDSKYTLGEQLWDFRINDEKALTRNVEDRMAVLELCQKATQEEPHSPKLWVLYGEYISHLLACIWDPNPPENWSEEDRMVGKEIFTSDLLMSTWQSGAEHVKYNLAESNLVWDQYLRLLQEDLDHQFNPDKARRVSTIFTERLSLPHATWDNTLSQFSTFNSKYNTSNYEAIMEHAVQQNTHTKRTYDHRAEYEFQLLQAASNKDQDSEYWAMTRYLKWEKKTMGVSSFPLVNALFERATLRFPVDPSLWEDYVEFLIWQNNRSVSLLDVLQRATRHCPWSGSLWSHRILTLEAENKDFNEIEGIKHSATETGMLEHADLEELIKVQIAWCGYLRRKAFDSPNASEDDADIAEIGIRSALELVQEMGTKKYGKDWTGDSQYRLERLHIKFWTQRGSLEEARQVFGTIAEHQSDSYEFWYRWYIWEMVVWSNHATRSNDHAGQPLATPSLATAVLEQGMKRLTTIDQPEPLLEMYLNHCEQHESVLEVRRAMIEGRRARRTVTIRRDKEAADAAAAQARNHVEDGSGKRKREDGSEVGDANLAKKSKQVEVDESPSIAPSVEAHVRPVSEAPSTHSTTLKRDREHTVVIVRNLPKNVTEMSLRKFFRDAGDVKDVNLKVEEESVTATVEFQIPEAAEYSLSMEARGYEGNDITITPGENSTLYVANYPAHADEAFVRNLFEPFGNIIQIRWPSLRYNIKRRFCYVQFSSGAEALAATSLHQKDIEGLPLTALISDPAAKKTRQENDATKEGREVYVKGLEYRIRRKEIQNMFSEFGVIESLKLPTIRLGPNKGNNRGSCFVIYQDKASADKAVAELNGKRMWDTMDLHVTIAKTQGERKTAAKKVGQLVNADKDHHPTASPEPSNPSNDLNDNDKTTTAKDTANDLAPVYDRSIALLNVPDTVNDVRLKALVDPYGMKRVTHLPAHGGAIVEFYDVASVGKATLELDGYEIIPGKKITVGMPDELKAMKAEWNPSTNFEAAKKEKAEKAAGAAGKKMMQPTSVRVNRPVARGGGGLKPRGRPGLGSGSGSSKPKGEPGESAKSNSDFRAMVLAGKEKEGKKDEEKKDEGEKDGGKDTEMKDST